MIVMYFFSFPIIESHEEEIMLTNWIGQYHHRVLPRTFRQVEKPTHATTATQLSSSAGQCYRGNILRVHHSPFSCNQTSSSLPPSQP